MKKLLISIIVLSLCLPLLAQEQEKEMAKEQMPSMAPPAPLNNDWFNWLVGEWQGWSESPMGKSEDRIKFELGLNGQFLMLKYTGKIVEMTAEQKEMWSTNMGMSEEDMEKMHQTAFKGLGLQTIDPSTGEIVGHWFDSWRYTSKGRGKIEGNKEITEWSGPMGSGTRITEKVDEDKLVVTEKWSMPDGTIMEVRSEMTRVKQKTDKHP